MNRTLENSAFIFLVRNAGCFCPQSQKQFLALSFPRTDTFLFTESGLAWVCAPFAFIQSHARWLAAGLKVMAFEEEISAKNLRSALSPRVTLIRDERWTQLLVQSAHVITI